MQRKALLAVVIAILVVGGVFVALTTKQPTSTTTPNSKIQVVAAENFWGSLVSQLGGTHISVTSIVSDPNTDPHEYESSAADAKVVANASLVIINGAGYDDWALQLISASNNPNQTVLNVQELVNQSVTANPHFWYSSYYVNDTVKEMYKDLVSIDPTDASYYKQQYVALNASLGGYNAQISEIKQHWGGVKVASTESIFVYLANTTGLNLVSPPSFMQAVSEGIDPSPQSIAQFDQLIQSRTIAVLVYNNQTVTPITQTIKSMAIQEGIPTVGITETVQPPNTSFQIWMSSELTTLQNALATAAAER